MQVEGLWARVVKRDSDGCWEWQGSTSHGYGRLRGGMRAHRFSWELHNGAIPDGINVCHRCDNPPCVRPDHLFLGSHADNVADKMAKGRWGGGAKPKLSESDIVDIRTLSALGARGIDLASAFNVTKGLVSMICSGARR